MASPRARTWTITVFMPYFVTVSYIAATLERKSFSLLSFRSTSISRKEIQHAFLPPDSGAAFALVPMAGDTASRENSIIKVMIRVRIFLYRFVISRFPF